MKVLEILEALNKHGAITCSQKRTQEAIVELKELVKPKTCKGCNLYFKQNNIKSCPIIQGYSFSYPEMPFYCSHYEQKD